MTKKKPASKKKARSSEQITKEALAATERNIARIEAKERREATLDGSAKRGAGTKAKTPKAVGAAKPPKAKREKRTSALDAAAQVLKGAKEPMNARALIAAIQAQKLWSPPKAGKTPHATLYSAMLREIQKKGREARFVKAERGHFTLRKGV